MTAPTRDHAVARAAAWIDDGRHQAELAALVAHPTEGQVPGNHAVLRRYLTEALVPRLDALGCASEILDTPDPAHGPLLIAEGREATGPAILCYGHGDMTHGQEGM